MVYAVVGRVSFCGCLLFGLVCVVLVVFAGCITFVMFSLPLVSW